MGKISRLNGENILYHYLQKDLLVKDVWLFQMLAARLVSSLGIWFHPDIYKKIPILLPFARRDSTCRKNCNKERIEQWGSPDENGYFRDDNSLIKGIPKSLTVKSSLKDIYDGQRIGTGFVACHVWRISDMNTGSPGTIFTTQNPEVYSFVPNLVWLPKQVAKLTDREGAFVQLYLQALSYKIFRNIQVSEKLKPLVLKSWNHLARPSGIPEQGLPEMNELNFFAGNNMFIIRRRKTIHDVFKGINNILNNVRLSRNLISSRYSNGLRNINTGKLKKLGEFLEDYLLLLGETNK
jgi:hypothetical protein